MAGTYDSARNRAGNPFALTSQAPPANPGRVHSAPLTHNVANHKLKATLMTGMGHLQPRRRIAIDGSLPPDSFRAGRAVGTEESGQKPTIRREKVGSNCYVWVGTEG